MTELPTGTVTFLFTDIEGSTRLLQELGGAYAAVRDEHARIVRAAIEEAGGGEVSTAGDSFFAAFPRRPAQRPPRPADLVRGPGDGDRRGAGPPRSDQAPDPHGRGRHGQDPAGPTGRRAVRGGPRRRRVLRRPVLGHGSLRGRCRDRPDPGGRRDGRQPDPR